MIDHMTFRVSDMARSRAFYAAALAPPGDAPCFEERFEDMLIVGLGHPDPAAPAGTRVDAWLMQGPSLHGGPSVIRGGHLCGAALDRAAVDGFHAAALAAGGTDNGTPGLRPHYHPQYYGAFVLDPDGNNVEVVCHAPA